jgi:hypothetical protein
MSEWTEYTKLLAGLIAIVNPLSAVPIYLDLTASLSVVEKKKIAIVATISTAIILIFFSLAGTAILTFFGITIDAFRIAGGIRSRRRFTLRFAAARWGQGFWGRSPLALSTGSWASLSLQLAWSSFWMALPPTILSYLVRPVT